MNEDAIIQLRPWLFFGPYDYTFSEDCLAQMTHIINCDSEESSTSPLAATVCKFRHMPSQDRDQYPILQTWLPEVVRFAEDARRSGGALYIHCYAGANRSAALAFGVAVCAGEPLDHLYTVAQGQTSRAILTNAGFRRQLAALTARQNSLDPTT